MRLFFAAILLCLNACTQLVFQPLRQHLTDPKQSGIVLEDRFIQGEDGVQLHGWWLPARDSNGLAAKTAKGTLIFLHGNAENISTHIRSVAWLVKVGYNVYLYDYRGYGKSEGIPDWEWARRDLRSAIMQVLAFPEVKQQKDRLFVFGQSLGGAIAISSLGHHPARQRLAGLIVEGSPASLRKISREILGNHWLTWPLQYPLSYLIDDSASPIEQIKGINPLPLLIAHSRDDQIIPWQHGYRLHQAANTAHFLTLQGPHILGFSEAGARTRLLEFLAHPETFSQTD